MAQEEDGIIIGYQQAAQGSPIVPKTPADFNFPLPNDPRVDNIKFNNEDGRWRIFDTGTSYDGQQLAEGSNYFYGRDIDVKATWWKKVNIVILCNNEETRQSTEDLTPYVHALNGHYPGPSPYNKFAYYSDNEDVTFNVTGTTDRVITIGGGGTSGQIVRTYRFIGWAATQPSVTLPMYQTFRWCSFDLQHTHENVTFDVNCRKDEYAMFIDGSAVEIIVTTNDYDNENRFGWDNNTKITYTIHWQDDENPQTHTQEFNSIPVDPINPSYMAEVEHVGNGFIIEPNLHIQYGLDDLVYEFQGWYLNPTPFKGFEPDEFAAIQPYLMHHPNDDFSDIINTIQTPIVLTAVYMPASNQYTITYWSGLPEPY